MPVYEEEGGGVGWREEGFQARKGCVGVTHCEEEEEEEELPARQEWVIVAGNLRCVGVSTFLEFNRKQEQLHLCHLK